MPFWNRSRSTSQTILSREELRVNPLPTLRLTLRNPGQATWHSRPNFMRLRFWNSLFLDARDRVFPSEETITNMSTRHIDYIFDNMQDDLERLRDDVKHEMKTMSNEEQRMVVEFWKEVQIFLLDLFKWLKDLFHRVLKEIEEGKSLNREVLRAAFNDVLQSLKDALNGVKLEAEGDVEDGSDDEETNNKRRKRNDKTNNGGSRDVRLGLEPAADKICKIAQRPTDHAGPPSGFDTENPPDSPIDFQTQNLPANNSGMLQQAAACSNQTASRANQQPWRQPQVPGGAHRVETQSLENTLSQLKPKENVVAADPCIENSYEIVNYSI